MKPNEQPPAHIPPLRFHGLTRVYDWAVGRAMPELAFRRALLRQAGLADHHSILDFGCGTATMCFLIEEAVPHAGITGVDVDEGALAIARAKAEARRSTVQLKQISPGALPFPDSSFDRVLSSLVFHHLPPAGKRTALAECRRALRPGGEIHIADWGRPAGWLQRGGFFLTQLLDGFETTADNVAGRLPQLIAEAGFEQVQERGYFRTAFGTLRLLSGKR